MSGKPSPEGVTKLRDKLVRLRVVVTEMSDLRAELAGCERQLSKLGEEEPHLRRAIIAMMSDMDVASNVTFGWEARVLWFLMELDAQAYKTGFGSQGA